jgi:hypothetical protein
LTALGFATVLLVHYVKVGAWDAFFKTHAHYGHGVHNPVLTLLNHLHLAAGQGAITSLQPLLFIPIVVGMIYAAELHHSLHERLDSLLIVYLVVFWLFPLIIGGDVTNRAEAPLMPCAYLIRRWPMALQGTVIVMMILIDYEMASLYYKGALI